MTICFDFGNTRLKYGIFKNGELVESDTIPNDKPETLDHFLSQHKPNRIALSSVINHNPETEELLRKNADFIRITPSVRLPFTIPVSKPDSVGADRLAISAYACKYFPNQNNLVVAVGSCITYNFINKYHAFLGGSISPGMEMRFKSMHELTAMLPLIERNWNFPLIGFDTRTNILSGVMLGMAQEINGIIDEYSSKFVKFNVLLTGGDTANFARHIKYKIFADPALILKGLYAISEYNHENIN